MEVLDNLPMPSHAVPTIVIVEERGKERKTEQKLVGGDVFRVVVVHDKSSALGKNFRNADCIR